MPPKKKAESTEAVNEDAGVSEKAQPGLKKTLQLKPQKPDPKPFQVSYSGKGIPCLRYYPFSGSPAMVFTHGAGGTLAAAAMVNFGAGFNETKPLLYFQGTMNLKGRTKMFQAIIEHEKSAEVLGGRSMGARAAVLAAQENRATKALVLASYPLKNEKGEVRDQILLDLRGDVEVLFISGDKDEMCDIDELAGVRRKMKARSWMVVVQGADHGMNVKPKKATDEVGKLTGRVAAKWLDERDNTASECEVGWSVDKGNIFESPWRAPSGNLVKHGAKNSDPDELTTAEANDRDESRSRKRRKVGGG